MPLAPGLSSQTMPSQSAVSKVSTQKQPEDARQIKSGNSVRFGDHFGKGLYYEPSDAAKATRTYMGKALNATLGRGWPGIEFAWVWIDGVKTLRNKLPGSLNAIKFIEMAANTCRNSTQLEEFKKIACESHDFVTDEISWITMRDVWDWALKINSEKDSPKDKEGGAMRWLFGGALSLLTVAGGIPAIIYKLRQQEQSAQAWRRFKLGASAAMGVGVLATIVGQLVMKQSEKASELKLKEMAFEYKQRFEGGFEIIDPRKLRERLTFNSIIGQQETLRELRSLAHKIANPALIKRFYPQGMAPRYLFKGPPGTGKTESIRALTCELDQLMRRMGGEHKAVMYKLNGALLSGPDGARMIHRLKEEINALSEGDTANIFMDEADSIPKKGRNSSPDDARIVNELLEILDGIGGFKPGVNVAWFFSTNRPQELEPALNSRLRLVLSMEKPSTEDLKKLFKQKFASARLTPQFKADLNAIAAKAQQLGFVGRDVNDVAELLKNWSIDRLSTSKSLPSKLPFTEQDLNNAMEKTRQKVALVVHEANTSEVTPFKLSFSNEDAHNLMNSFIQASKLKPTDLANKLVPNSSDLAKLDMPNASSAA